MNAGPAASQLGTPGQPNYAPDPGAQRQLLQYLQSMYGGS